MRRVNSDARIIKELNHALLRARVRPYYLHQMDVAEGLEHLRTPISAGRRRSSSSSAGPHHGPRRAAPRGGPPGRGREGDAPARVRGGAARPRDRLPELPRRAVRATRSPRRRTAAARTTRSGRTLGSGVGRSAVQRVARIAGCRFGSLHAHRSVDAGRARSRGLQPPTSRLRLRSPLAPWGAARSRCLSLPPTTPYVVLGQGYSDDMPSPAWRPSSRRAASSAPMRSWRRSADAIPERAPRLAGTFIRRCPAWGARRAAAH